MVLLHLGLVVPPPWPLVHRQHRAASSSSTLAAPAVADADEPERHLRHWEEVQGWARKGRLRCRR